MIHIYYGEGKGKTTAAMGLALRALGQGLNVTIAQFLKDGKSGEIEPLKKLGATIICDSQPMPFTWQMSESQWETACKRMQNVFERAMQSAGNSDLVVLDEALCAMQMNMLCSSDIIKFLQTTKAEVVLTGSVKEKDIATLIDYADYVSEIKKHKYPYDSGMAARRGIEY